MCSKARPGGRKRATAGDGQAKENTVLLRAAVWDLLGQPDLVGFGRPRGPTEPCQNLGRSLPLPPLPQFEWSPEPPGADPTSLIDDLRLAKKHTLKTGKPLEYFGMFLSPGGGIKPRALVELYVIHTFSVYHGFHQPEIVDFENSGPTETQGPCPDLRDFCIKDLTVRITNLASVRPKTEATTPTGTTRPHRWQQGRSLFRYSDGSVDRS